MEDGVSLVPLVGMAALPSLILLSDGGVGDIDVDDNRCTRSTATRRPARAGGKWRR